MLTEVKKRQKIEKIIARRLALDALKAGYTLGVNDGEETVIKHATTAKAVLEKMFSVDEELMLFYKEGKKVGWVQLIYGNGGWDVIADYTTNLEPLMENVNKLSDKYSIV